jgi:hypothetical protein
MLSFEIVLGGDQSKWKIGGVKCVTFAGQLENKFCYFIYV